MNKRRLLALTVVALLAAGWLWWRGSAEAPASVAAAGMPEAWRSADDAGDAPPPAPVQPSSAASAAPTKPVHGPFENESAADLLRKVQVGFGDGSAQQALEAANVLQFCAHAEKAADAMRTTRGIVSLLPEALQEFLGSLGGITDEQVERAQHDARRCQVFDDAALARRGELLKKAHEGGAQGAAMALLNWFNQDGKADADPALVGKLQAEVRQAALDGDFGTLAAFAFMVDAQPYGASPTEREAYKQAWLRIADDGGPGNSAQSRALIEKLEKLSMLAPLTAAQQREAEALAQQLYDAHRRRQQEGR